MIKIDFAHYLHDKFGAKNFLGFRIAIMVEGGSMLANSNIVGYQIVWRKWKRFRSPGVSVTQYD